MSASRLDSTPIRPRRPHEGWWATATSGPSSSNAQPNSVSLPTPTPSPSNINPQSPEQPGSASTFDGSSDSGAAPVFTSIIPVTTVMEPTTTFTSFSETILTLASSSDSITSPGPASSISSLPTSSTTSTSAIFSTESATLELNSEPVCIGHGLDSSSEGLIASLVLPSAIGLLLWFLFAIVRPRFRQIYGLREWFVQHDLRPKPLGSGFFAFLFPHVPLVPSLPSDISNAGRSAAKDAELFPSDEQLSQRALWVSLMIVLGWTILGLIGALPLYLVSTPCLAENGTSARFGGAYSTLLDLSLMRLLRLLDNGNVSTVNLVARIQTRAEPSEDPQNVHVRVIVLTALTILLGVLPPLWKIVKELNALVAYRRAFTEVRCEGKELGWLSATQAPGFVGWGEQRLKDFILKTGLSYSMEPRDGRARARNGEPSTRTRDREERQPLNNSEEANLDVDVQSLFSIGDTQALALLIEERDEILENLEIAETRYISSFRVTTPDASIADYENSGPVDSDRPYISRPLPLGQNGTRRAQRGRRRHVNPAFAASSLAPTSFVAPSQYYKLHSVQGVSGGRFADSGTIDRLPSLAESINSRVIGSRFIEVNRNSVAYGRLPLGSHVIVERSGQLGPGGSSAPQDDSFRFSAIPDPRRFGPNYGIDDSIVEEEVDEHGLRHGQSGYDENYLQDDSEWVDLTKELPRGAESEPNGPLPGPSTFRRRPKKEPVASVRRETFPLRGDGPEHVQPPHLRLQPSQPFVRPMEGLNFDDLGHVYADITTWRSRLKVTNAEIAEAQRESYNDIADGARIKGWLMIGRGLRYMPGVQLIEGRAKEDIRWDVLQNERSPMDAAVFWAIVFVVIVLLAAGLTAASGLALATAPNMAHYLPFLKPLLTTHRLLAGIATVLAPAVAATLFISIALCLVHWVANVHGSISISGGHLFVFKVTFFILTTVASLWLVAVGALLFALRAFDENSGVPQSVASGSIYMSILALSITLTVAITFPALLVLQPFRLWRVLRDERQAVTPRQRFRGLIFLSRKFWIEGGILVGAGVLVIIFVEAYTAWTARLPGRRSLSPITQDSLNTFEVTAWNTDRRNVDDEGTSRGSSTGRYPRLRGSMASVLEMMSLTLAVMPSPTNYRGPVPLPSFLAETETLDDLTATERAARTHPDAPPHLPPLPFTDHAEDMAGILYAPELIAPPPIIWLPNDSAGVARSEAVDLQKYHDLAVTLDVRALEDVLPRRSSSSRRRGTH
ncbi:hypothetical protein DXG03_008397 [Asterophora parasitica]|uniref:CSC1/OSCA1-like 7TM region domain-containing protein n=1 Tax=Asterophora parasitica TaxID=117018 RepID=A0A9P7GDN5_9AGAR|nr:hypothetical protein DXG03_008397 [Asterophora parasitica]